MYFLKLQALGLFCQLHSCLVIRRMWIELVETARVAMNPMSAAVVVREEEGAAFLKVSHGCNCFSYQQPD
jgi:hypothetical protein